MTFDSAAAACSVAFEILLKISSPAKKLPARRWSATPAYRHRIRRCLRVNAARARPQPRHRNNRLPCSGGAAVEKPGPQPMTRVGCQGELRHQQQIPLDLLQTEVHFSGAVAKIAIFEHSRQKPQRRRLIVAGRTPTSTNSPCPIEASSSPAICTRAWSTLCSNAIMRILPRLFPLYTRFSRHLWLKMNTIN